MIDGSGDTVTIMMTTADMALRMDPDYEKISRRYHENPDQWQTPFSKAWFKLIHRDMNIRYLGKDAQKFYPGKILHPPLTTWLIRQISPV